MIARVTVLLVDDHAVVREGYRRLLERAPHIEVVGEAADAQSAYQAFAAHHPDVVVMDISLPGVSGIEATRRLLARKPDACILIFSIHDEAVFASRALEAGARGYLTKASAPDTLVEAVEAVASGKTYLGRDIAQALAAAASPQREAVNALSARELEVLRLIVQGYSLREIGEKLGLTAKTVANHQSAIKQKLGAETGAQLVRLAVKHGLVGGPLSSLPEDTRE
jgi:two-component system, NarL family, invasion response regulator UvrY